MSKRRYAFYEVTDQNDRVWPSEPFLSRVTYVFRAAQQDRYTDGEVFSVEELGLVENPWGLSNTNDDGAPRYVEVILPIGFNIEEYEHDLAPLAKQHGIGIARCGDGIVDLESRAWEACTPPPVVQG